MLIVHGTASFRDRVPGPEALSASSTTALGAWYANLVRWRTPLALFVNERTLLPVLVPLAPARTLLARLPAAAAAVMSALDIPRAFIDPEVGMMQEVLLAPTASRQVVGVLTEDIKLLTWTRRADQPDALDRALWLAGTPSGPLGYDSPAERLHTVVQALGHPTSGVIRRRRTPPAR